MTAQVIEGPNESELSAPDAIIEGLFADGIDTPDRLEAALRAGSDQVCGECEPNAIMQAKTIAMFVGIGRLTVEAGIEQLNARLNCHHVGVVASQFEVALS
jgi:hypothetical protein